MVAMAMDTTLLDFDFDLMADIDIAIRHHRHRRQQLFLRFGSGTAFV
jgi:hypothetical protein